MRPSNGGKEMLLAISVKNFKSIREARVQFGSLTCLIGHNGVGKSNLFDAIHFLSLLADRDIHRAAAEVRRMTEGSNSPLDLVFGRDADNVIELSADMITPKEVADDFGQPAQPSTTLLTYTVQLRYQAETDQLLVQSEHLAHAKLGDFKTFVGFPASAQFRSSVAVGARRGGPLISTNKEKGAIELHGDGGSRGRPAPVGTSPLTVVGGTNTFDYPTVLAAKREMSSWRMLQLEPSAMRSPDRRGADPHVSASGGHLAATLNSLKKDNPHATVEVVNRLRALNSDVVELDVFTDEVRDQLALRAQLPGVDNWLFGRSLSDGTLRYIALVLMLVDTHDGGLLCLEEPENGIHPSRVPSLVNLLYDYGVDVDVDEPVDDDNPLRQVVMNSHSPEVARQLHLDDLVFAERAKSAEGGFVSVFRPVAGTWRARAAKDVDRAPLPKDKQAVADFIGGSPLRFDDEQLRFEFGTVS
jgi:predicted ATPase